MESTTTAEPPAKLSDIETYFGNIVKVALEFAGIVLFIMLIVGGFNYITAGGNPQQAEAAKKTITYAIFGIVLLAMSFLILKLISELGRCRYHSI
jgi:hypothetical protein